MPELNAIQKKAVSDLKRKIHQSEGSFRYKKQVLTQSDASILISYIGYYERDILSNFLEPHNNVKKILESLNIHYDYNFW